jgi:hypothetical protein
VVWKHEESEHRKNLGIEGKCELPLYTAYIITGK